MKQGWLKKEINKIKYFLKRLDKKETKAILVKANEWREFLKLPPLKSIDEMIEAECVNYMNRTPIQRNCIKPVDVFHIRYREVVLLPIFDKLKKAGVPAETATQDKEVREAMKIIELKTGVSERLPFARVVRKNGNSRLT